MYISSQRQKILCTADEIYNKMLKKGGMNSQTESLVCDAVMYK